MIIAIIIARPTPMTSWGFPTRPRRRKPWLPTLHQKCRPTAKTSGSGGPNSGSRRRPFGHWARRQVVPERLKQGLRQVVPKLTAQGQTGGTQTNSAGTQKRSGGAQTEMSSGSQDVPVYIPQQVPMHTQHPVYTVYNNNTRTQGPYRQTPPMVLLLLSPPPAVWHDRTKESISQ